MRAARFHPGDGLRIEDVARPTVGPGELRDVLELARRGRISTELQPVDLEELPATFERLEAGGIPGRAVVVP